MRADVIPTPEKRCMMCGARFQRSVNANGRLEDRQVYLKRRFCSISCSSSRDKGGLSRNSYQRRARALLGKKCECCGASKRLHAHHVDEDWTNNAPENVQTLCVFCHQFWHATHRRLGVKPSAPMPSIARLLRMAPSIGSDDCAVTAMQSLPKSRKPSSKP